MKHHHVILDSIHKTVTHKIPSHLIPTVNRILSMATAPPPSPWNCVATATIGGLQSVGFGRGSDLLLVTSSQGRGVFNCLSGERLARDRDEDFFEDPTELEAAGIGPFDGTYVRMAGIHGGGLAATTSDG